LAQKPASNYVGGRRPGVTAGTTGCGWDHRGRRGRACLDGGRCAAGALGPWA